MTYTWYKIFNVDEFSATELVSKEIEVILLGIGQKKILITRGVNISIVYEGVMLTLGLNQKNPFEFEGYAVYSDSDHDVWLGIANED